MRLGLNGWTAAFTAGAAMLLVLAACGGDDPTAAPAATSTPTPEAMMEATATPDAMVATAAPTAAPAGATAAPAATAGPTAAPTAAPTAVPAVPDPAVTFEGKTIRIVANSSPGGGTDTQGRVMAAFMSQYIPGNPRVVFTNQPNKPLEYIFSATEAPKDGTYISWNSSPQLNYGFNADTKFIKRSTFEPLGSTIDPTRAWITYDAVGNLGPSAATNCLWDYSGMSNTGGGTHGEFLLADELSDIAQGNPTLLSTVYASEQLDIPFRFFGFTTVDTNALFLMWARGDVNSTVQPSYWHRFPLENPGWLETGFVRQLAGMGPGTMKPNSLGPPQCGDMRDYLNDEQKYIYNSLIGPPNFASKALWLPPGTPDNIADTLSAAFETALTQDEELIRKYAGVAGESPGWIGRDELTAATIENEMLFEGAQTVVAAQMERLLPKYFSDYIGR